MRYAVVILLAAAVGGAAVAAPASKREHCVTQNNIKRCDSQIGTWRHSYWADRSGDITTVEIYNPNVQEKSEDFVVFLALLMVMLSPEFDRDRAPDTIKKLLENAVRGTGEYITVGRYEWYAYLQGNVMNVRAARRYPRRR